LQLTKLESGYALNTDGPLQATLNFPAIFLAKLPAYISRGTFTRGILSGNLTVSESIQHPKIAGDANLIDGQFLGGSSLSLGVIFKGEMAAIDFARIKQNGADILARGEIDLRALPDFSLKLVPGTPLIESISSEPADCVKTIEFLPAASSTLPSRPVNELDFSGSLFARSWTVSLPNPNGVDSPQTFSFCFDEQSRGKTLTLRIAPSFFP